MTNVPTIDTERLTLRGWRESDLDAYAAMMADPEVMRFLGGASSRGDAWRGMATLIGHWALRGFGLWAVERKSDGALIGRVGIQYPEGWPSTEVAWTLARPYWGQGYATEAAQASLDYGFKTTEKALTVSDFLDADEIFSTGNHSKVVPVTRIENRDLQPGPVAKKARQLYWDWAHSGENA